ncbi:NUDIX domain-containing protein [Candidatus Woesearchaeota archaeon]|jgi:8-oxo-dGTP pyrophosphatase MutT (NUDIX family)|nr:NUDIX domain-containing protein [Candidatus Woesearchaeota archaeon]MBT4387949.1 NUDIX domain-containing protein [Candidatus Woesearchaeota archaeon]MBT4595767.1 NUDIX domain-containing protein [Candidatus Woesearchaeota archaeon]MBT5741384.1 NUDIX domain-containing protein [Candidatus Woesearchaeota archaeon]MBT6505206.1 NUDIX domain-containing protein [Candidatus Woesearchaeota archaeon]
MGEDTKNSAVLVIPQEENSDYFLTYLTPNHKIFAGRFRLPGGKLQSGENYESTLKRELQEEYGIFLANVVLHYQKPNVLGGTIYLCSAQKHGNPIPKESGVGPVLWMNAKQIFESNMVPNCKIAVCAYLLDKNPNSLKKLIPTIFEDKEFLKIITSEAKSLYEKIN